MSGIVRAGLPITVNGNEYTLGGNRIYRDLGEPGVYEADLPQDQFFVKKSDGSVTPIRKRADAATAQRVLTPASLEKNRASITPELFDLLSHDPRFAAQSPTPVDVAYYYFWLEGHFYRYVDLADQKVPRLTWSQRYTQDKWDWLEELDGVHTQEQPRWISSVRSIGNLPQETIRELNDRLVQDRQFGTFEDFARRVHRERAGAVQKIKNDLLDPLVLGVLPTLAQPARYWEPSNTWTLVFLNRQTAQDYALEMRVKLDEKQEPQGVTLIYRDQKTDTEWQFQGEVSEWGPAAAWRDQALKIFRELTKK